MGRVHSMKYFRDDTGEVWAFKTDGSQDRFILSSMVEMPGIEVDLHLNPPLSNQQKIDAITASIQDVLDTEARSRNYDDINAIGKYIGYDNAFRVECEALGAWTANVWLKAYELLATWEQTGQEVTKDEVLAQLPAMGA